ncbi:TorF family putative porin [Pseudorhodoplanes sp.]|uniref:TorF family putative porin n=1 Tax=Pseudorhodoplanes sp. TaxID=1934341 RepID=UPI00391BC598
MKKYVMPAMVAAAVMTGAPALAADIAPVYKAPPAPAAVNPWNVAIGGAVMTDYNFRGISQSDRGPSAGAYFEGQFKASEAVTFYAAVAGISVDLATNPTVEMDYYGGVRLTYDKLTWDFGFWYYHYPKEGIDGVAFDTDFWEVYGKLSWAATDALTLGVAVYYADDWLKTGASGTYLSGTLKYVMTPSTAPVGAYVSGEIAHYWLGTQTVALPESDLPDYTYWNAGIGFTYKALTLDLRYHDTNLSKEECSVLSGNVSGFNAAGVPTSKWCGEAYIAKLSFDTTLADLK